MANDEELRRAAMIALTECLAVKEGERVLIITNLGGDVYEICQELFRQASELKAVPVMVIQQDKDTFTMADPAVLDAIRGEPEVIITICRGRVGKDPYGMHIGYVGRDGQKYSHLYEKVLDGDKRTRSFWSPNCTREIFERGVPIDYALLRKNAKALKERIDAGKEVRVTSPAGTDVRFGIDGRQGHYDDGDFTLPGKGGNLPTGEVYVSPSNGTAEGVIVFDGTVDLDTHAERPDVPVRVRFEKGYAVEITGGETARQLEALLERSATMARDQGKRDEERNARHLGELGIGLNPNAKMSCNTLEDEKVGGTVHFAIGMNLENDAHALVHLDCLVLRPDVYVDDVLIIKEGRPIL
ncbi:MAG TPA: aminopeptidase [Methanomassiliicoccales archaeon]|nr:aminopeptidase [Methanomassiliicoccales archaeon]HPR98866.1 aminopeptidase [Methanomassiliicoccales archaeon]